MDSYGMEQTARRVIEILKKEQLIEITDIKDARRVLSVAHLQQHGAGVTKIIPGTNISISSGAPAATGLGDVTISTSGGSPGGSDTQIQYNNSGSFGGDSGLTWNKTTKQITISATGSMVTDGDGVFDITNNGDGYGFNITASNGTTNNSTGGNIALTGGDASPLGGADGGGITQDAGDSTGGEKGASIALDGGNNGLSGGTAFMQGGSGGVNPDGDVVLGLGNTSTTRNGNFVFIPATSGAPTGTPTAHSGAVPMTYDTGSNKLYIYNSGWKSVQLS